MIFERKLSTSLFLSLALFIISLFASALSRKVQSSSLITFSTSFANATSKLQVKLNMSINLELDRTFSQIFLNMLTWDNSLIESNITRSNIFEC